jgi:hypothetical protein
LFSISAFKHVPFSDKGHENDEDEQDLKDGAMSDRGVSKKKWWQRFLCVV